MSEPERYSLWIERPCAAHPTTYLWIVHRGPRRVAQGETSTYFEAFGAARPSFVAEPGVDVEITRTMTGGVDEPIG